MIRLFLIFSFFLLVGMTKVFYPFHVIQEKDRFIYLLKNFRCLVCQNQDLLNSNSEFSNNLKNKIYMLIMNGENDVSIINYIVSKYGSFILLNPFITVQTIILWFGPVFFLLLGLFIYIIYVYNSKYDK
ncbi:cytochrome c-type biogenesis protein [Candidatus Legionella polyplacis]